MLLTITVIGTSPAPSRQPLQTTSPSCLQVSKITSVAVGKITSLSWFSSPTTRPMTTTIPIGDDPLETSMFTWPKWVILLVALISTYPYLIKIYSLQICKRLQECSSECPSVYLGLLGPMVCIRRRRLPAKSTHAMEKDKILANKFGKSHTFTCKHLLPCKTKK